MTQNNAATNLTDSVIEPQRPTKKNVKAVEKAAALVVEHKIEQGKAEQAQDQKDVIEKTDANEEKKRVKKARRLARYGERKISSDTRAVMETEYVIGCYSGQLMIHRNLEFISGKLFNLSVIMPVLARDEKVSGLVEKQLIKIFDECENHFKKGIKDIEGLLSANKVTNRATFQKELTIKIKLDNPYTGRFMNCIRLMDEWTRLLETGFIVGLMESALRNKLVISSRRKIKGLANEINKLESRARGAINRQGKAQEAIDAGAILDGSMKLIDIDTDKEINEDTEELA